ncbi:hypothetical protein EON79_17875 [bacterium]|nr:MAG: hypothetical protein EON79_17875 [bacterium]
MFRGAKAGTERVEFQVRKVTRYLVTEWHSYDGEEGGGGAGSHGHGEFDGASAAFKVASALADVKHKELGWEEGDPRIQGPDDGLVVEERKFYDDLHAKQRSEMPQDRA